LKVVSIPGRASSRVRDILSLQASLHRVPARRPASIVAKSEFGEALAYLRLGAETRREHRNRLQWWDAFLLQPPSVTPAEPPVDGAPAKRKRKKRRFRRRTRKTPAWQRITWSAVCIPL